MKTSPLSRRKYPIAAAALICGFASMVVGTGAGLEMSRPAHFNSAWTITWTLSICGAICALILVRLSKERDSRLAGNIALGCALLGSWCPTYSYYGNYFTYPWFVVASLAALSTVGAYMCGMRLVPLASFSFLAAWFGPTFLPPTQGVHPVLRADGLECELNRISNWRDGSPDFTLRDLQGRPIVSTVDCGRVRTHETSGPLLPEDDEMDPLLRDDDDQAPTGALAKFGLRLAKPSWASSTSLSIIVPRWPHTSVAHLVIPLKAPPQRPQTVRSGEYTLTIKQARWGKSTTSLPVVQCLRLVVEYSGFGYSGSAGQEIGMVDDLGNRLGMDGVCSVDGSANGASVTLELTKLNPKAKSLRIELYSPDQIEKGTTVFNFGRV
ncbi:MAG: hypothetical protein P4L46_11870 [Fimbriimonas sp.]|nr:hypothetical protein [Fimbriimonas sp.]